MFQWYKAMERAVITMNEHGAVFVPDGEIWMSEMELTDLFGVIAPTVRAAIRAVYKSCVLKEYEAQKYIRLENGYYADVYSFPMVVALAFRINSYGAQQVRNANGTDYVKSYFRTGNDLKTFLLQYSAFHCVFPFLPLASSVTANALFISHSVPFLPFYSFIPEILCIFVRH